MIAMALAWQVAAPGDAAMQWQRTGPGGRAESALHSPAIMTSTAALPPADRLICELGLRPHPEGGFYRETYRSTTLVANGRTAATMIYFLLLQGQVSRLHRIDADEGWHLYLGGALEIFEFHEPEPDAAPRVTRLGTDLARGERPQHIVPAGRWFGAAPAAGAAYALVGCTVAPGFEFSTFELAERAHLTAKFPDARDLIHRLT